VASNSNLLFSFSPPSIAYLASATTKAPFRDYCSGGKCIPAGCSRWTQVGRAAFSLTHTAIPTLNVLGSD
jgi:hypothetical protein